MYYQGGADYQGGSDNGKGYPVAYLIVLEEHWFKPLMLELDFDIPVFKLVEYIPEPAGKIAEEL